MKSHMIPTARRQWKLDLSDPDGLPVVMPVEMLCPGVLSMLSDLQDKFVLEKAPSSQKSPLR